MQEVLKNALPELGVKPNYNEEELELDTVKTVEILNLVGLTVKDTKIKLQELGLGVAIENEKGEENKEYNFDDIVTEQFPLENENINIGEDVIIIVN